MGPSAATVAPVAPGPSTIEAISQRKKFRLWTKAGNAPYEPGSTDWARRFGATGKPPNTCMNAPSTTLSRPAIALAGVNLSLGRGAARVHILKSIDLQIRGGEAVGFIGPSGS